MQIQSNSSERNSVIRDIFTFFWIPLMKSYDPVEYEEMGRESSVTQLVSLTVMNSIVVILGVRVLVGGNPYIRLSDYIAYPPFILLFVFLAVVGSLLSNLIQFLCFRMVSGKGNIVAHGYLTALATSNLTILFWVTIAILYFTRISGIDSIIMGVGGLYLLVPSFLSLKYLHKISTIKTIVGFAFAGVAGTMPIILNLNLLAYFIETFPFQINHWLSMSILSSLLITGLLILAYYLWEKELEPEHPIITTEQEPLVKSILVRSVPIREPFKKFLKVKWVQIPLGSILFFTILFLLIEIGSPDLKVNEFPLEASILVPAIFIFSFVLVFLTWEHKLFMTRPENVSLKISIWKILEQKRGRVFWLVFIVIFVYIYSGEFIYTRIVEATTIERIPVPENSSLIPLDFTVIDAEYSLGLDRIVMVSTNPNHLHVYDPLTRNDNIVELSYEPTSVSVGPTGNFAAVGHDHHISYIDLQSGAVDKILNVDDEVFEVVVGNNGWIYALPPRRDNNEDEKLYFIESSGNSQGFMRFPNTGSPLKLNFDNQNLYGATDPRKSRDQLFKVILTDGEPGDIPISLQSYSVCFGLWFSEDGKRIYSASGNVFIASNDHDLDMKYVTSFSEDLFPVSSKRDLNRCNKIPLILNLSDSSEAGRTLAIIISEIERANKNADEFLFSNELAIVDSGNLEVVDLVTLPSATVDGFLGDRTYYSNGRFVFFNAAGTRYYVITQASTKHQMLDNFSLFTSEIQ